MVVIVYIIITSGPLVPDMGTKHLRPKLPLRLQLRGFKKWKLQLRDLGKASASASAPHKSEILRLVLLSQNLKKLNIFHFQITFACIFWLNVKNWQVIKGKNGYFIIAGKHLGFGFVFSLVLWKSLSFGFSFVPKKSKFKATTGGPWSSSCLVHPRPKLQALAIHRWALCRTKGPTLLST